MNSSINGMGVTDQMIEVKAYHSNLVTEALKKIKKVIK